jgi:hypothetical protein
LWSVDSHHGRISNIPSNIIHFYSQYPKLVSINLHFCEFFPEDNRFVVTGGAIAGAAEHH